MPPPLPFPLPLHVGTDICRISRIAVILRGPHCRRFVRRVLSPEELTRAKPAVHEVMRAASERSIGAIEAGLVVGGGVWEKERDGVVMKGGLAAGRVEGGEKKVVEEEERDAVMYRRAAEFVAGRFAAKEAAFKAHPHLKLGFHDVLILTASGAAKLTGAELMEPSSSPAAPVALIKARQGGKGRDQMARVSISHDGGYSTAVCIGFEAGPGGDGYGGGTPMKGWLRRTFARLWS